MTDDAKALADRVVALGIGRAHQIYPDALGRFYQIDLDADWQSSVSADKFVSDYRVVLAMMNKFAMDASPEILRSMLEAGCDVLEDALREAT